MKLFNFLNFVHEFRRSKEKAKAIKADPVKQPKSMRFGVSSIIASVLGVGFAFVVAYGIKWLTSDNLWLIIAGAVIGLIGLAGIVSSIYKAVEGWAFQLYVNKSPVTWISLVTWILAIAAIIVIIVLFI